MSDSCETCRYWNATGARSSPGGTYMDADKNRVWARPCQRFPDFVFRYPWDWCGEHVPGDFAGPPYPYKVSNV